MNDLQKQYFNWLYENVCDSENYQKLFQTLYETPFRAVMIMDENRISDGVELRYRFASENGIDLRKIVALLDTTPCSVLEMMVALSFRCETQIMDDPEIGDRKEEWFWIMLSNLGLRGMSDNQFNEKGVHNILTRFINRKYDPDGRGGLFVIKNCRYDLRTIEIWYQMMWFLDVVTKGDQV